MTYYTVAHLLHGEDNLDAGQGSPAKIQAEDLTDDVWDFVFLNTPLPKESKLPQKTLEKMRKEKNSGFGTPWTSESPARI